MKGGWKGVTHWNTTGAGAYEICQALGPEKLASAGPGYMTNIEPQLKWCHSYAQEGYGRWEAAWAFLRCVGRR